MTVRWPERASVATATSSHVSFGPGAKVRMCISNGVRRAKSAESRDVTNNPAPHETTQPPSTRWAGVAATCTEASLRILYLNEAVAEACLPLADLRATILGGALRPDEPHAQSARTQALIVAARRRVITRASLTLWGEDTARGDIWREAVGVGKIDAWVSSSRRTIKTLKSDLGDDGNGEAR
jgi:hypothetical protein